MEIRIFQKFDPNAERGLKKTCEICLKQFGVFNQEHQCKRCIRAVCSKCVTDKRDIYKQKMTKSSHRPCLPCAEQSNFIIELISINKLQFGRDSDIAIKWHKGLTTQEKGSQIKSTQIRGTKKFTFQIFQQLWDSYNFSLREFIGMLTLTKNQKEIYAMISQVYDEIQKRGVDEKMQFVIFMIVFLLCFSSVKTCSNLIYLLHKLKKTIGDGKQLLSLYLKNLGMNQGEIKRISDYTSFKLKSYVGALSVNTLTTECSYHLVSKIFEKKKIDEAFMLYALALSENKQFLLNNRPSKSQCDLQILRKCKLSTLLMNYKRLVPVNSTLFINLRKSSGEQILKKVQQKEQVDTFKLQKDSSNEEVEFVADFRKRKISDNKDSEDDSESNKTKSIRESSDIVEEMFSPRKTQKFSSINPSPLPSSSSESSIPLKKEHSQSSISSLNAFLPQKEPTLGRVIPPPPSICQKCQERVRTIQELEQKIEKKDRQISKLHTQLTFKSKQLQNHSRQKNNFKQDSIRLSLHNEQIAKLEEKLQEKCEENQKNFKVLTKYQKQIMSLKSEIEQLTTSNKLLQNRLQSASFSTVPVASLSRNTEREQELGRQNELLKKTLLEKNKQLQQLMKKNKLLSFQIDENQKNNKSKLSASQNQDDIFDRARKLERQNKDLMSKLNEITEKVNDEQEERLRTSSQLFELKEYLKQSEQSSRLSVMSMPSGKQIKQQNKKEEGCSIF